MHIRCCLVDIARKSLTETANVERKFSGVDRLFCRGAKVTASAMVVHGWFPLINGD